MRKKLFCLSFLLTLICGATATIAFNSKTTAEASELKNTYICLGDLYYEYSPTSSYSPYTSSVMAWDSSGAEASFTIYIFQRSDEGYIENLIRTSQGKVFTYNDLVIQMVSKNNNNGWHGNSTKIYFEKYILRNLNTGVIFEEYEATNPYTGMTGSTFILPDGYYELLVQWYSSSASYWYRDYFTYKFYIDTEPPNNGVLPQYTNKAIEYKPVDSAGISKVHYRHGESGLFTTLNQSTVTIPATQENNGRWYFYATDMAGFTTSTTSIFLDTIKPSGTLKANNILVASGAVTNKTFSYTAQDLESGLESVYLKRPGGTYTEITNGAIITATTDGWHYFKSRDKTGNESEEVSIYYDSTPPIGFLYTENGQASNGVFISSGYIKYSATDEFLDKLYVKLPDKTDYEIYDGRNLTDEGIYSFYSLDKVLNQSSVMTIGLDRTAPTSEVYAATNVVPSGSYVNSGYIKYSAQDLAIDKMYVKLPGTSNYITYTGTNFTNDGEYSFYSTDKAFNQSAIKTVILDNTKPLGVLYAGSVQALSGSFVKTDYIKYSATDNILLKTMYVKLPGASSFIVYSGTNLTDEGTYNFYSEDAAKNKSDTLIITLDRTKPIGQLYAGENLVPNNSYTNLSYIKYSASDINTVNAMYVKLPGSSSFIVYTGNNLMDEGIFNFYSEDLAENKSEILTITIDRTKPIGQLYAEVNQMPDGSYTNLSYIKYSASDIYTVNAMYVKFPGSDSFTIYSGNNLTGEGIYSFYSEDLAFNKSDILTIILDRTKPTGQLYAEANQVPDGSYTNSGYIKYSASDLYTVKAMYVILPGAGTFIAYNGTNFTNEGTYKFYSEDLAGNKSDTLTITLDRTKPIGQLYIGESLAPDGSYTNSNYIKYSASDNFLLGSMFVRLPGTTEYIIYYGAGLTDEGIYYFYLEDAAKNKSDVLTIAIDRTVPIIKIYADTNLVESGSFVNPGFILFEVTGGISGIKNSFIKLPGSDIFVIYTIGTKLTASGTYYFYAETVAGNISSVVTIIIDRGKPTGNILSENNVIVNNGSYTNKAFKYSGTDFESAILRLEIKRPGYDWETYIEGTLILSDSGDGIYRFRCIDLALNVSDESVIYLDTNKPHGKLYADDKEISSGSFTNALRITFKTDEENVESCYVKLPGEISFKKTTSGALYSDEGRYEFYIRKTSGTESEIYVIIIDRSPKALIIENVSNNKTIGNVLITWNDTSGKAAIISVTVNGYQYEKGTVIKTINGGEYAAVSTDAAGNIWTYSFTAIRTDIATQTSNKYWWETKDLNQNVYAFETYENALAFATARENSLVKTSVWNNNIWDSGYMMDTLDYVNAKQGTFYIYKKWDNTNIEVAYFTLERLNAVIKNYAEKDILMYYYWHKTPAQAYEGNNLYSLAGKNIIISNRVELNQNANFQLNESLYTNDTISNDGKHVLYVYDDWGNGYTFTLYIITKSSVLSFREANGDFYTADNSQAYYLKNRFTIKVEDSLDEYAVALIKNSSGEVIHFLNNNEQIILSDAGKYIVITINHSGQKEYIFYISPNAPSVIAHQNVSLKRLEAVITLSKDKDIQIVNIEILFLTGSGWELLSTDDYGKKIEIDNLKYSFFKSGKYRIIVEDTCRNGIDKIVYECEYSKPEPNGILSGVNENGYANKAVKFTWTDEAYAILLYKNTETEYISGTEITEDGEYKIIFSDYDGQSKAYEFIIDKTPAEINISVKTGDFFQTFDLNDLRYVNGNVILNWDKQNCTALLYYNGILFGEYIAGTELTEDGEYRLELYDRADNKSVVEFIKHTVIPTAELIGTDNGGKTKGSVTLENPSVSVTVTAYLNGQIFDYKLGQTLTTVGSYKIIITDEAGLTNEYCFEILYSFNFGSLIVIAVVLFFFAAIAATIIIMRKRKKFKTKAKPKKAQAPKSKTKS